MTVIYVSERTKQRLPERVVSDFYPTKPRVAQDALKWLPLDFHPQCILDPGAGGGVWGEAARKRYPGALITGVEVRSEARRPAAYNFWFQDDYLLLPPEPAFDLIVGNPPYKIGEPFVQHSLKLLEPGGYLIFLFQLRFLEGQHKARHLWWRSPPRWVVVKQKLPFGETEKVGPAPYMYVIWQKCWTGETVLKWSL